jgi:hypothetical protein
LEAPYDDGPDLEQCGEPQPRDDDRAHGETSLSTIHYSTHVHLEHNLDDDLCTEHLRARVEDLHAASRFALELLSMPEVEMVGTCEHGLIFETTDAEIAKEFGFEDMLVPGSEELEPAPWTAEAQNGGVTVVVSFIPSEAEYQKVLDIAAKNQDNPLLRDLPTWGALVEQGKVEAEGTVMLGWPKSSSFVSPSGYAERQKRGEIKIVAEVRQ